MAARLLTSSEAAKVIGISARSLSRWVQDGKLVPTLTTPGGQARWDLDDLRGQLRDQRKRDS
jgi:predicted site-specific integrase-resolvase